MSSIMRRAWWLTLVVLALALQACGNGAESPGPSPDGAAAEEGDEEPRELVHMRYATRASQADPLFAYWTVAEEMGYFEEEGIRSEVVSLDAGEQAVVTGQVELTVAGPNNLVALRGKNPEPLEIISIFSQVPIPHYVYAVMPDSPIQEFADVKGKRIGVPSQGHSVNLAVTGSLSESGLTSDDVEVVVLEPGPSAVHALTTGQVDMLAYHDTAVVSTQALMDVELREVPLTPEVSRVGGPIMIARKEAIETERDAYVGYLRAFLKGWVFANESPEAAMRIQLDRFPEMVQEGQTFEEALDVSIKAFQARNRRQQVPEGGDPPIYGWHYEDGWSPWTELIPDVSTEGWDVTDLYTNDLIEQAWEGLDEDAVKEDARNYET